MSGDASGSAHPEARNRHLPPSTAAPTPALQPHGCPRSPALIMVAPVVRWSWSRGRSGHHSGPAVVPVPRSLRLRSHSGHPGHSGHAAALVPPSLRSHVRSGRGSGCPGCCSGSSGRSGRSSRPGRSPGPAQSRFRSPHGPAVLRPGLQPPSPYTTPRSGTSASVGPPEASVPTQRMPPTQSPIFPLPLPPPPCHRPRERYLREGSRAFPHPIELQLYTGRGLLPYRLAPDTTTSSGTSIPSPVPGFGNRCLRPPSGLAVDLSPGCGLLPYRLAPDTATRSCRTSTYPFRPRLLRPLSLLSGSALRPPSPAVAPVAVPAHAHRSPAP
ncbi:hypothetical protein B0H15DRAFT_948703 [Mycena belliarum]|uniref:Uncharacterized protein n=1 Tax=Mycena belliarum TaxID=1033014 RepID=A0AAD6XN09_9AGAR|nr:hypothetical protein B0H15DRAFT_948703 [Mycena belliae]